MELRQTKRIFGKTVWAGALLAVAGSGLAQDAKPLPVEWRLGVGYSLEFETRQGENGSLFGPEIGLNLPLGTSRGVQWMLSPSYFMGGRLASGADVDGNVIRFHVLARRQFSGGNYVDFGLGVSSTVDRADQFDNEQGLSGRVTFGFPTTLFGSRKTSFEVTLHAARARAATGVTAGLNVRF